MVEAQNQLSTRTKSSSGDQLCKTCESEYPDRSGGVLAADCLKDVAVGWENLREKDGLRGRDVLVAAKEKA